MRNWVRSHIMIVAGILLMLLIAMNCLAIAAVRADSQHVIAFTTMNIVVAMMLMGVMFSAQDIMSSRITERMLKSVSATLHFLANGLSTDGCHRVCEVLLPETKAVAVAMTDRENVIAYVGEYETAFPPGSPIHTPATHEVLASGRLETFTAIGGDLRIGKTDTTSPNSVPAGIVVPLIVSDETIGTIKFYYASRHVIDRNQVAIARGLGELVSTQLSSHELDRQAELVARAEVKALQAQINPHFLFNTLNTIAALVRTDPMKARALLREFAVFYRQTLENSESRIPLSRELEQTRRYLGFEYARFGEERISETETIDEGCEDVLVPAFIVQPIVENAVRHAMREEGTLHIDVHVTVENGSDVLIAVADDGLGMSDEVAQSLLEGTASVQSGADRGTGIALRNVAERLERFYGYDSGVEIVSKLDEGTCVTLRLAHVFPSDTR